MAKADLRELQWGILKKMVKKAKKEPSLKEKKEWILKRVQGFQKALRLTNWNVRCYFDGDWQVDNKDKTTLATIKADVPYQKATLTFHQDWLGEFFLLEEELSKTILHELSHLLIAPYRKLFLNLRAAYIESIRTLTNDMENIINENFTQHLTRVFMKEYGQKVNSAGASSE